MDDTSPSGTAGVLRGRGLGAVVLAAGAGRRFGADKRMVSLDGRPMLQHVLDTLSALDPFLTVVVVRPDAGGLDNLSMRDARLIVNPAPDRGLSSSVRLGVAACEAEPGLMGAFLVLGDQPRTAGDVLVALAEALPSARERGAVAVVPSYADGGGSNPVLLLRGGFPLTSKARGDQGLGAILATRPELVLRIGVPGSNPDVDTVEDLRALRPDG